MKIIKLLKKIARIICISIFIAMALLYILIPNEEDERLIKLARIKGESNE